jgi:hypothetical protein
MIVTSQRLICHQTMAPAHPHAERATTSWPASPGAIRRPIAASTFRKPIGFRDSGYEHEQRPVRCTKRTVSGSACGTVIVLVTVSGRAIWQGRPAADLVSGSPGAISFH